MSQNRYNILLSAYACDPNGGGERGNGWNWSFKLAEKGHKVWCLTDGRNKVAIQNEIRCSGTPENLHFYFIDVPKWVKNLYRFQPGVYFHYLYWQHLAYKKALLLTKENSIDLVHHVTWGSLQLGSEMYKLKIPFIFGPTGGGQMAPKIFRKYFRAQWKQEIIRLFISYLLLNFNWNTRRSIRQAKVLFAGNRETVRMATSLGAKNIRLHSDTGLPLSFFPKELPARDTDKKLRILWVGRLFARKGLLLVLEVLSKLPPRIEFELTIIGDGPMGPKLKGWIKQYKLENKVKCLGQVPWHETSQAYRSHNLFMFCSLRDSFASQLMEAMAYGLPVLTLNINGARDLVPDDCGIKVEAHRLGIAKRKLLESAEYFYEHPEERDKMGQAAFEYAKSFEWSRVIDQMSETYGEVLKDNKKSELPVN